jgi:di/tricarboxylate transporter
MWLALIILAAAIVLFITEWLRVDVVAIAVMVALMLTGLLSTGEALSGFSNPAVLTIAALFIVGGAVMQTGLADWIGRGILSVAGTNPATLILIIMVAVALLSSFMSSTGTVAVLLPAIVSLARNAKISPSRLLIPLAFGSLLGGALTLIGTPPNLIASDVLREAGMSPFQLLDFTPMGLILLVAGILFMLLVGRHFLPDHMPVQEVQRIDSPVELVELYRLPDNLFRLRVRRDSGLVGKSIVESRLGENFQVSVLEILKPVQPRAGLRRSEPSLGPRSNGLQRVPVATHTIGASDTLVVQGDPNNVRHAAAYWNLGLQPAKTREGHDLISDEVGVAEVLLPPRSSLAGQTLVESRFGSVHHLTVLGISRPGAKGDHDLKDTVLQFGDTLLVQGAWHDILALRNKRRDFVVIGEPEAMAAAQTRRKAPLVLLILAGMLALLVTNATSVAAASMLAALAVILTGCVTIDQAYEAVDWKSIVLVAGMLPMSIALEHVGLVNIISQGLIDTLGVLGPLVLLAGLFVLTALLTQVVSNTAATVVLAPIALAAASKMGVQPYALVMAVAMAASMGFASPVASPVNALVMGAGAYRFGDYARVGVPLLLICLVLCVLFLPLLFPF